MRLIAYTVTSHQRDIYLTGSFAPGLNDQEMPVLVLGPWNGYA